VLRGGQICFDTTASSFATHHRLPSLGSPQMDMRGRMQDEGSTTVCTNKGSTQCEPGSADESDGHVLSAATGE
jgi:hypothetical protein